MNIQEAARKIVAESDMPDRAPSDDGWRLCELGVGKALYQAIDNSMTAALRRGETWFGHMEVDQLIARSNGLCELTGIRFSLANPTNARRRPFLPSIDRIEHAKPYSLANCRLICCCINIALNDWGDGVFWTVVEAAWKARHA